MADKVITISDSHPCFKCGADLFLTENQCLTCGSHHPPRWDIATILGMFQQGLVLDVTAGGLVLGRDDAVDDIPMLYYTEDVYVLLGRMQGGEFIMRTNSSIKHRDRLEEINSYEGSEYIVNSLLTLRMTL